MLALLAGCLIAGPTDALASPREQRLYRSADTVSVPDRPVSLATVDPAGDGFDDILVGSAGGPELQVLRVNDGRIKGRSSRSSETVPAGLAVREFDEEIFVAGPRDSSARTFGLRNRQFDLGENAYPPPRITPLAKVPVGLGAVDAIATVIPMIGWDLTHGDRFETETGLISYMVANRARDEVTLIGSRGGRRQQARLGTVPVGDAPLGLTTIEGWTDLVWVANSGSGTLTQLQGPYQQGAFEAETLRVGGEPVAVEAGNFVWGDGNDPEIAVADRARDQLLVLDRPPLGGREGYEPYRVTQRHRVGRRPVALHVADLDDRWGPDIAIANSGSDTVSVLLGGNGRLDSGGTYPVGHHPVAIESIEYGPYYEGDLIVANRDSDDLTVLVRNEFGRCRGHAARLRVGGPGRDGLGGAFGPNESDGRGGDDRVWGGGSDDCLRGGHGDDRVSGGSGDDRIWPGPGDDDVRGGSGDDEVFAQGGGGDSIDCGGGVDTVHADRGDEVQGCEDRSRPRSLESSAANLPG